ncbi:MAG: hypothetical protein LBQ54_16090 [Planctomycetaceae bacterium]|jgi:hypothetical protein|nr:hypothetical protein [Planctomycetaceae bacterium]
MSADGQTCRLIADGTAIPNNNPLPMVAGKRAASPHIASGWKDDSTEAEWNAVTMRLLPVAARDRPLPRLLNRH